MIPWEVLTELRNWPLKKNLFFQNADSRFLVNKTIRSILIYKLQTKALIMCRYHSNSRTTANFLISCKRTRPPDAACMKRNNQSLAQEVCLSFVAFYKKKKHAKKSVILSHFRNLKLLFITADILNSARLTQFHINFRINFLCICFASQVRTGLKVIPQYWTAHPVLRIITRNWQQNNAVFLAEKLTCERNLERNGLGKGGVNLRQRRKRKLSESVEIVLSFSNRTRVVESSTGAMVVSS